MLFTHKLFQILILTIFLTACNTIEADSEVQSESDNSKTYEDEILSFVVPFEAGGGTDVFARFMTPYFAEHIKGNPSAQVENIPGGASITGTNEYANVRPQNGLNILTTSASSHVPYILEQSSVDYELDEFKPVFGAPSGGVVYTTPEFAEGGYKHLAQLEDELYYAGISPTGLDLTTILSFEVLDLDVHSVLGYEGRGPSRVAFEQGESNIDYQTTTAYNDSVTPLVDNGDAVPLYSLGQIDDEGELVRDPQFPDLPTIEEIYIDIYDEEPSGDDWEAYKQLVGASYTMNKVIWVHENAPDVNKEILDEAMEDLLKDENFHAKSEETLENYDPYIGVELEDQIEQAFDITDETHEWISQFLMNEFDVDIEQL